MWRKVEVPAGHRILVVNPSPAGTNHQSPITATVQRYNAVQPSEQSNRDPDIVVYYYSFYRSFRQIFYLETIVLVDTHRAYSFSHVYFMDICQIQQMTATGSDEKRFRQDLFQIGQ